MIESVPACVSILFILSTFAAIGFLLQAVRVAGLKRFPSQLLIFLIPLWLIFQAIVSVGGFYQDTDHFPPRLFLCGVFPALIVILLYFVAFRETFLRRLPLNLLTLVHIVRVPVEIVLLWLYMDDLVPRIMTFDGWNFDILSGMLSPIAYLSAFRGKRLSHRWILVAYNIIGIVLLANIVVIATLSIPTPIQLSGLDVANRGVLYFPYVWLPTIVVPIVLFSHVSSLYKLWRGDTI